MYRTTQNRRYIAMMMVAAALVLAALACTPTITTGGRPTPQPPTEIPPTDVPKPTEVPTATPTETGGGEIVTTAEPVQPTGQLTADNAANLHEVRAIQAAESLLYAGAISPVGHQGATYGFDKYIRIWDIDSGSMLYQLGPTGNHGWGMAYSPDGTKLAVGGGFEVSFWDPNSGRRLGSTTTNAYVFRIVWSPDGSQVAAVGDASSRIEIIDANTYRLVNRVSTSSGKVLWAAAYSPDGAYLAVADYDSNLTVFNANGGLVAEDTATGKGATWDLEFSPDGSMLAACSGSGDIYFWDTSNWTTIPYLILRDVHSNPSDPWTSGCTDGIFSKDGSVYISVGGPSDLMAWDTATGNMITTLPLSRFPWSNTISGDGTLIGVSLDDGSFRIFSAQ